MLLVLIHVSVTVYVALCCSGHEPVFCIYRDVVNLSSFFPPGLVQVVIYFSWFSFPSSPLFRLLVFPTCLVVQFLVFPMLSSVSSAVVGVFCVVVLHFLFLSVWLSRRVVLSFGRHVLFWHISLLPRCFCFLAAHSRPLPIQ